MNKTNVLLASLAIATTAACSSGHAQAVNSAQATYTVEGQDPNAYFAQFVTKNKMESHMWYGVITTDTVVVGKNLAGQDIVAETSLFMHPDHSYVLVYSERDVLVYSENGYEFKTSRDQTQTGEWKVVDDHVEFSDFAKGYGLIYNQKPAMQFTFTRDLATVGLKGQTSMALRGYADNCPAQGVSCN